MYILYLVGGVNHLEKYESVNGKDDIPYIYIYTYVYIYIMENNPFMFETTNQICKLTIDMGKSPFFHG